MRLVRRFHQWIPRNTFAPVPLTSLDLQSEYSAKLASAVEANLPVLSAQLKVPANAREITHRLLSLNSGELKNVRLRRAELLRNSQETAPAEEYAAFLRFLYAPTISETKLEGALNALPASNRSRQAFYIQEFHLETLINRSLEFPSLFKLVHDLLERAELPLTARERASYVYATYQLKGNWREALAHSWPAILESQDTGAFNQLLKLAFQARCKDTQSLVLYHVGAKANRFTYALRLRHQRDFQNPPAEIMREFQSRHFVVDTIFISSYISGLLRFGRPHGITAAERVFNELTSTCSGVKPVIENPNQVANCLTALDKVAQLTRARIEVPLYIDTKLLERMYAHYVSRKMDEAAVDVLKTMAKQDCILPRKLIATQLLHTESTLAIEHIFGLCFDFNLAHPGFISNSFAQTLVKTLCENCGMTYEDALDLVTRSRAYETS